VAGGVGIPLAGVESSADFREGWPREASTHRRKTAGIVMNLTESCVVRVGPEQVLKAFDELGLAQAPPDRQ